MITAAIRAIQEWARTGDKTSPTDSGLDPVLDWDNGWPSTFSDADGNTPRRSVFQYLFNVITAAIVYFRDDGVPEWDAELDYPLNAFQKGSDGNLYRATEATGPDTSNATDPTSAGQLIWTQVNTARTAAAPDAPAAPSATASNGRLDWSWECPSDNGAKISGFEFQQRKQGSSWPSTWTAVTPPHTTGTGLTNGTTYEARVRAINSVGTGAESGTGTGTPVASVPDRVRQIIAESRAASIFLQWSTPDDGGDEIDRFEVQWKSGVQNWSSARQRNVTGDSDTIPNLVNGTTYDVRVRAVNGAGNGEWSPTVDATPGTGDHVVTASGSTTFVWPWATDKARVAVAGGKGGGGGGGGEAIFGNHTSGAGGGAGGGAGVFGDVVHGNPGTGRGGGGGANNQSGTTVSNGGNGGVYGGAGGYAKGRSNVPIAAGGGGEGGYDGGDSSVEGNGSTVTSPGGIGGPGGGGGFGISSLTAKARGFSGGGDGGRDNSSNAYGGGNGGAGCHAETVTGELTGLSIGDQISIVVGAGGTRGLGGGAGNGTSLGQPISGIVGSDGSAGTAGRVVIVPVY